MTGHLEVGQASRRRFLAVCSAVGLGQTLLPGVLWAMAAQAPVDGAVKGAARGDVMSGLPAGTGFGEDAAGLPKITPGMIDAAAGIAGITLTDEQKAMVLEGLTAQRESVRVIRTMHLPNSVAPAFVFDPVPGGMKLHTARQPMRMSAAPDVSRLVDGAKGQAGSTSDYDLPGGTRIPGEPGRMRTTVNVSPATSAPGEEALAFATVRELAELLQARKVSSVELSKMYLGRLKKYDSRLHFVITLTEARAMEQAAAADREIAAGKYRGPLHGIPWGGKDLLAVKGYRTTWGAAGFEGQSFDYDATVVERLDAAGAVLLAKLSMGALAQGDLWFGARTRNPWNAKQGSSGSSAGSASAVGSGCVAFALGTETLGSISSPSTRCGVTGLRPTFGFVPRTGAMALSWTMDKIGPICRAVEDCALVMDVIHGPDDKDRAVKDAAFNWDAEYDWKQMRVGYLKSAFEVEAESALTPPSESDPKAQAEYKLKVQRSKDDYARRKYDAKYGDTALDTLRNMGVKLIPMELPKGLHFGDIVPVLGAEGAAAFDELTRSGRDKLLTGQRPGDWPNQFRRARFYSAVDYVQAQRARMLVVDAMARMFEEVDVIVTPSGGAQLTATNLSGHPAVIVPNGVRGEGAPKPVSEQDGALENVGGPGTPVSLTFLGALYSDARLAAFARAYQEITGFHLMRPVV